MMKYWNIGIMDFDRLQDGKFLKTVFGSITDKKRKIAHQLSRINRKKFRVNSCNSWAKNKGGIKWCS